MSLMVWENPQSVTLQEKRPVTGIVWDVSGHLTSSIDVNFVVHKKIKQGWTDNHWKSM